MGVWLTAAVSGSQSPTLPILDRSSSSGTIVSPSPSHFQTIIGAPSSPTFSPAPSSFSSPSSSSSISNVFSSSSSSSSNLNSFSSLPSKSSFSGNSFSSSSLPQSSPSSRPRFGKQIDVPTGGVDFSQATRTPDGRLCVIKQESVETLSKDPILECKHKNVEKCHYTYITYFKPAQEETCDENFEKSCQITFKQEAVKETIRKCYRPLEKVCNGQGPQECRTVYESACSTRYVDQGSGKFVGDTKCEKQPVEICGQGCVSQEGPEECHDKQVDTLVDVPEETCDLNPQKTCRLVTKLVPSLRPKQECTTVPQETCTLKFTQPKRVEKPLQTEWCLDEGEESQPTYNGSG